MGLSKHKEIRNTNKYHLSMKYYLLSGIALCAACVLTSCKSKESAYRQAYEKAKAMENNQNAQETTPVVVTPVQQNTPTQTVTVTPVTEDHSDVRTIPGGVTVVNGEGLKSYSVVVGSFVTQANAEGLMTTLRNKGYAAQVVKTNETINGHTGWFRVIASTYANKADAVSLRNSLQGEYVGAWLLFTK